MEQATPAIAASSDAASTPAADQSVAAPDTTQAATPAQSDDLEYEIAGEKVKLSDYKRLKEIEAKRKELDRGAHDRFQKSAQKDKEADAKLAEAKALVANLTKDTKAQLRAAGIDPVQFAEQTLAEALEEHDLTPEQKELREYKLREAQRKEADDEAEAQKVTTQAQAHVEHYTNEFSHAFIGALKPLNLPEDDLPEAVLRMAQRVEALMEAGAPIDLSLIAEDVSDRLIAAPAHRFQSLSDEELLRRYPAEAERFRKALVAKHQATKPSPVIAKPNTPASKPKAGLSRAEFEARVAKRIGANP